jgi:hypothetical protein
MKVALKNPTLKFETVSRLQWTETIFYMFVRQLYKYIYKYECIISQCVFSESASMSSEAARRTEQLALPSFDWSYKRPPV